MGNKLKCIRCKEVIEGRAWFTNSGKGPWCTKCMNVRSSEIMSAWGSAAKEIFEDVEELEGDYKVIKLYSETLKGKEFTRSLIGWCMEHGIQVSELPVFLMCVVKIPSLDIDYDEAYRDLVEKEWLTVSEHKVFTNRKEVISRAS